MVATAEYFRRHRWAWIASTTAFWNDPGAARQKERMTRRDRYEKYLRSLIQEAIDAGEIEGRRCGDGWPPDPVVAELDAPMVQSGQADEAGTDRRHVLRHGVQRLGKLPRRSEHPAKARSPARTPRPGFSCLSQLSAYSRTMFCDLITGPQSAMSLAIDRRAVSVGPFRSDGLGFHQLGDLWGLHCRVGRLVEFRDRLGRRSGGRMQRGPERCHQFG